MKHQGPLRVRCSTCGATPGAQCHDRRGKLLNWQHPRRVTAAEYVVGKTKTAPNPHVSREPAEFDAEVFLRALRKLKRAINREASPYQIAKLEVVIDNLLA